VDGERVFSSPQLAQGGKTVRQAPSHIPLTMRQPCSSDRFRFAHGAIFRPGEGLPWLIASYHPSRQSTQPAG